MKTGFGGFFFGVIALLVAISKPEYKKESFEESIIKNSSNNNLTSINTWKCLRCNRTNYSYVGMCACGNTKSANENSIFNTNNTSEQIISEKQDITISVADEIAKFKKLLDDGVITQEEFDKKKEELLNM